MRAPMRVLGGFVVGILVSLLTSQAMNRIHYTGPFVQQKHIDKHSYLLDEAAKRTIETTKNNMGKELYGEYHDHHHTGWNQTDKNKIRSDIKKAGFQMMTWIGEQRTYEDMEKLNQVNVPIDTPGIPGNIYSGCSLGSVSIVVAIGMNFKRANRVVATLMSYRRALPIALFVYGDFAQQFPDAVKFWSKHFTIGLREDGYNPPGHLQLMPGPWVRMGLISAILRLQEIGIRSGYYMPSVERVSDTISREAERRGLRIVKAAVEFPARKGSPSELTWNEYYDFRDFERTPRALRNIHRDLVSNDGGVFSLDTDLPDTYMNSVFMMDYLSEMSGFKLVDIKECIAKSR